MKNFRKLLIASVALLCLSASCGTQHKVNALKGSPAQASLAIPDRPAPQQVYSPHDTPPDTMIVTEFEGRRTLIMNAVRDEDGEMVATDRIAPSYVTARFRNVAERHGRVDLEFQVFVPQKMLDSEWQIRLNPDMYILGDSLRLEPVIITGAGYRKAQLRGYQRYRRFLDSIVTDTTLFVNRRDLEVFIKRNMPDLYAFRSDTTFVSEEEFASAYGVTGSEATEHYTYGMLVRRNRRRIAMKDKMYARYVKSPIITENIRLDTVIRSDGGDFIYNYVQTIRTQPRLRKVDISLSGGIWEQDRKVYDCPRTEPLTFYISSVSGLADNTGRYLTRIISRKVEENTACYIEFPQGKADIVPGMGNNPQEMGRIKRNIKELLANETYGLDSIIITSFASPEGRVASNDRLCSRRAASAGEYFQRYVRGIRDSIARENGVFMDIDGGRQARQNFPPITFSSRSGGENWYMLDALVRSDESLGSAAKQYYESISGMEPDAREKMLSSHGSYRYLREHLYPRLRIVRFNFYLHRKGMQQDTLYTTEPDTLYMNGLQCLRDHDYLGALGRLRSYEDINTAIAYLSLDRNKSALGILENLPGSARADYLKALAYSREGDERKAVELYLQACTIDPSYVHRGNLDPEISALIRKYGLGGR